MSTNMLKYKDTVKFIVSRNLDKDRLDNSISLLPPSEGAMALEKYDIINRLTELGKTDRAANMREALFNSMNLHIYKNVSNQVSKTMDNTTNTYTRCIKRKSDVVRYIYNTLLPSFIDQSAPQYNNQLTDIRSMYSVGEQKWMPLAYYKDVDKLMRSIEPHIEGGILGAILALLPRALTSLSATSAVSIDGIIKGISGGLTSITPFLNILPDLISALKGNTSTGKEGTKTVPLDNENTKEALADLVKLLEQASSSKRNKEFNQLDYKSLDTTEKEWVDSHFSGHDTIPIDIVPNDILRSYVSHKFTTCKPTTKSLDLILHLYVPAHSSDRDGPNTTVTETLNPNTLYKAVDYIRTKEKQSALLSDHDEIIHVLKHSGYAKLNDRIVDEYKRICTESKPLDSDTAIESGGVSDSSQVSDILALIGNYITPNTDDTELAQALFNVYKQKKISDDDLKIFIKDDIKKQKNNEITAILMTIMNDPKNTKIELTGTIQ